MKNAFARSAGVLAVAAALVLQTACAPMSAQGIRDAGNTQSFTVPINYQAAYRILLDEMRRCMQGGLITATVIVHGDLFTDIHKGVITPTMHGGFGAMPLVVVDIVELDPSSSRMDVLSKSAGSSDPKLLKGVFDNVPLCQK